jgi:hypothetical protein
MGLNPKKCSYPLKPPKSAQTLKKCSGMAESVSNQGFARKSATMESPGQHQHPAVISITPKTITFIEF